LTKPDRSKATSAVPVLADRFGRRRQGMRFRQVLIGL
jgi:hypothetical protein